MTPVNFVFLDVFWHFAEKEKTSKSLI